MAGKTKKLSVIGGSGFVGTNLCKLLDQENYDFEIIDLEESRAFAEKTKVADIRNLETLRNALSGEIVVHLAAVHTDNVRDMSLYEYTNVIGTKNIIAVCKEKGIANIIFTSSVAVYGFTKTAVSEEGEINFFNEYGRTKYLAEKSLLEWSENESASLQIVRPTVIFGKGNRGNVFNLLNQIASGRFVMVGRGNNKKSMAYVENVAAFIKYCIDNVGKNGIYNYSDEPALSMNELVLIARKQVLGKESIGFRIPYVYGLLVGFLCDFFGLVLSRKFSISSIRIRKFAANSEYFSISKFRNEFIPPYTLKTALNEVIHSEFSNTEHNG